MAFPTLTVLGTPVPQGSMRAFAHRSTGKVITLHDKSHAIVDYRGRIAAAAAEVGMFGRRLEGPIGVTVVAYLKRPAYHTTKAGLLRRMAPTVHTVKPDLDKIVRAVNDGLVQAGVIVDDAQIVQQGSRKYWCEPDGDPVTLITVETL